MLTTTKEDVGSISFDLYVWPQRIDYLFAFGALLGLIAVGVLIAFGTYSQIAVVPAVVSTRESATSISSNISGTIDKIYVVQGQKVQRGDRLFEVVSDAATPRGSSLSQEALSATRVEHEALVIQRDLLKKLSAASSMLSKQNIRSIKERIDISKAGLREKGPDLFKQEDLLDSLKKLHKKGIVSLVMVQQQEAVVMSTKDQIRSLRESEKDLDEQLISEQHKLTADPLDYMQRIQEISGRIAQLDVDSINDESAHRNIVVSPGSGIVTNMMVTPGLAVSARDEVLAIAPEDRSIVLRSAVPSSLIRYAKVGEQVSIRIDAYPYQTYGQSSGRICGLSLTPVAEPRSKNLAAMSQDPVFDMLVCPDSMHQLPGETVSRLGLHANVVLHSERKRIYEWIIGPIKEFSQGWLQAQIGAGNSGA